MLQKLLDTFYYARKRVVTIIVYLSMRLYGSEASFNSLWTGTFNSAKHSDLNFDKAQDLDTILGEVKDGADKADERRSVVISKCNVLFTLSSLLLGIIGVLMPKAFAFSHNWMKVLFFLAMLAFVNVVVLLVFFFGVGNEMKVNINQIQANLDSENLKKNLINLYRKCSTATENRTDFLVEIYKVAQFFFLSAFTIVALLFALSFSKQSPDDDMRDVLKRLRGNPAFIEEIRGERGDRGQQGERGQKGDRGDNGIVVTNSILSN